MTPEPEFRPGFRLSELDVGILLASVPVATLLAEFYERLGIALLFTVAHFFLFCNIVRMRRSLELCWAAIFVALASSTFLTGVPPWDYVLAMTLAVTVLFVVIELTRPSYHGAFWRKVNPELPQWWDSHRGDRA